MSKTLDEAIDKLKIDTLKGLLEQCTAEQQEFFNTKVYPNGIENMDDSQIRNAIMTCERTIKANNTND